MTANIICYVKIVSKVVVLGLYWIQMFGVQLTSGYIDKVLFISNSRNCFC